MGTLFSSRISISTLRHMSTPSSSSGRWRGKSTRENRVWSGSAKMSAGWSVGDKISTCINKMYNSCITAIPVSYQQSDTVPEHRYRHTSTLVFPGTGTGTLSNLRIQVSISRTSCRTMEDMPSYARPVSTLHTVSLYINIQSFNSNCFHSNIMLKDHRNQHHKSIGLPRDLSGSTHTSWRRVLIAGINEFLQYE